MAVYDISSPANEQVKRLVRLQQRRHRDEERLFVVEEPRIVERALEHGHVPIESYVCPDYTTPSFDLTHVTMSREAIDRASYRRSSTGIIALFPYWDTSLDAVSLSPDPLLLVAEGLEKPGNLGALLRIADGAGADGVILVEPAADPFNPNTVRSSTGTLFTVPVATADRADVVGWLRDHDISSVATSPVAASAYWDAALAGPVAIWVGSEAMGLSHEALANADESVSIPMYGGADSLNTAVSAALVIYEAVRQRRHGAV
ncbi:MAG: TrmH family RNA methyltransferase [Acidimicrobiia bacterium]